MQLKLRHQIVQLLDLTTDTCTIVGKDVFTGQAYEIPQVSVSGLRRWDAGRGKFIQDALPELSVEQREFLLTGLTPENQLVEGDE